MIDKATQEKLIQLLTPIVSDEQKSTIIDGFNGMIAALSGDEPISDLELQKIRVASNRLLRDSIKDTRKAAVSQRGEILDTLRSIPLLELLGSPEVRDVAMQQLDYGDMYGSIFNEYFESNTLPNGTRLLYGGVDTYVFITDVNTESEIRGAFEDFEAARAALKLNLTDSVYISLRTPAGDLIAINNLGEVAFEAYDEEGVEDGEEGPVEMSYEEVLQKWLSHAK